MCLCVLLQWSPLNAVVGVTPFFRAHTEAPGSAHSSCFSLPCRSSFVIIHSLPDGISSRSSISRPECPPNVWRYSTVHLCNRSSLLNNGFFMLCFYMTITPTGESVWNTSPSVALPGGWRDSPTASRGEADDGLRYLAVPRKRQ